MGTSHKVVSRSEWLAAREALLAKEKAFTRSRDALSAERRALPWQRVDKAYTFDGPAGKCAFRDLFDGRSQLVVYHFMFAPDWEAGCKSCSFWLDSLDPAAIHLNQRDVSVVAISRAPLAKLAAFKARMGWRIPWISSQGSDFNYDFGVSFHAAPGEAGSRNYNYGTQSFQGTDGPGISVFATDETGAVFHTYSCYARGLDMLNAAYHYLDLVPKGRDEAGLAWPMEWVRHHDAYGA